MEYMPGVIEDERRWNICQELLKMKEDEIYARSYWRCKKMEYMPGVIEDERRWNICHELLKM